MINRIFILLTIFTLASCSNNQKKESNDSSDKSEASIAPKLEGVIIEPQTETDTLKGSPKAYAVGKIGGANFTINYYSPATRGRMIWGGLVAYDNVWVTGAHKATSIEFDRDIKVGETIVKAGKYALFTIPGKDQWAVIINKNWNQHLADDYNETEDIVRLNVVPETEEYHQERLRYVIEDGGAGAGEIVMYWEKLELSLPVSIVN